MTNVEGPTTMVFFHDRAGASESTVPANSAANESIDYLQARERFERMAAKRAQSMRARQVHQELAQYYAEKVRQSAMATRLAGERPASLPGDQT